MVGLVVTAPLSTYDSATAELVRRELDVCSKAPISWCPSGPDAS